MDSIRIRGAREVQGPNYVAMQGLIETSAE